MLMIKIGSHDFIAIFFYITFYMLLLLLMIIEKKYMLTSIACSSSIGILVLFKTKSNFFYHDYISHFCNITIDYKHLMIKIQSKYRNAKIQVMKIYHMRFLANYNFSVIANKNVPITLLVIG